MSLIAATWIAGAFAQAPVPANLAGVAGYVLEEASRAPIRGAHVSVRRTEPAAGPTMDSGCATITNDVGRYECSGLEAGRYFVTVLKAAFVSSPGSGAEVTLRAGGQRRGVNLTLQSGAVIAGRVLDEFGEPAADAHVFVMEVSSSDSVEGTILHPVASVRTNDLGEFRAFGLRRGEYYVQAAWADGSTAHRGRVMLPTYFPGTSDRRAAQTIRVGVGQVMRDVVIAMSSASSYQISGIIIDQNDRPVSKAMVRLESDQPAARPGFIRRYSQHTRTDTYGRFAIPDLVDGAYTLVVTGAAELRNLSGDRSATQAEATDTATRVTITVDGGDVRGIEVRLRSPD